MVFILFCFDLTLLGVRRSGGSVVFVGVIWFMFILFRDRFGFDFVLVLEVLVIFF